MVQVDDDTTVQPGESSGGLSLVRESESDTSDYEPEQISED